MWMKVDDGLHAHRKTRTVTKSHPDKRRDIAPMGLWVAAGSWAGQNNTNGWIPADELDRWDDAWEALVDRLVAADYWWPEDRGGEPGYGFVDWSEWNTSKDRQSADGRFGNHERWHVRRGVVKPGCEFCPEDPESASDLPPDSGSESVPDIAQGSGCDRVGESETVALPDPNPTRSRTQNPSATADAADGIEPDRFDEFWNVYGKKVDRKKAEQKWKLALKKRGVTADMLIAAARSYVTYERENNEGGRYVMDPARWLNGERWNDERAARAVAGPAAGGDDAGWASPAPVPSIPPELVDDPQGYAAWLADWNAGKPVLDADGHEVRKEAR